jgi:hypothetical protein
MLAWGGGEWLGTGEGMVERGVERKRWRDRGEVRRKGKKGWKGYERGKGEEGR